LYNFQQEEHQAGKVDIVQVGDQTYHPGDYVYIQPRDKGLDPHIVCIDRMWKEENGEQWLNGCWFLRPNETYHLATRKFLEKVCDFCMCFLSVGQMG